LLEMSIYGEHNIQNEKSTERGKLGSQKEIYS